MTRFQEAVKGGPGEGAGITPEELNRMLDDYYAARGWNSDGTVPSEVASALLQ